MKPGARLLAITAATIGSIVVLGACSVGELSTFTPPTTAAPTTSTSTSTTLPPTTTTTAAPESLRRGDEGPQVQELQAALQALGYRIASADGTYGASTASAVMAFQKHEGLQRDGVAGPQTFAAVEAGHLRPGPSTSGPGPRLEVDLDRQIMFVTLEDGSVSILNVSTGNNQTYDHPDGYTATAVTPKGEFAVGRKIDAAEHAPLGVLYRPMYFVGGYAVHGSTSVPGYPASHGCVRVSYEDEDWLYPKIPIGTPVVVVGGAGQPAPDTDRPAA